MPTDNPVTAVLSFLPLWQIIWRPLFCPNAAQTRAAARKYTSETANREKPGWLVRGRAGKHRTA